MTHVCDNRNNHFNLIRFLAAFTVIISHACPMALGDGNPDPIRAYIGETVGFAAVQVFFAISGFLITQSFLRRNSLRSYVVARVLRIFPALIIVLLLTVFVLGPLYTAWPLKAYFSQPETYSYLWRNGLLYSLELNLPSVFNNNPYGPALNTSIWTLFHELVFYIAIAVFGLVGILKSKLAFAAVLALFAAGGIYSIVGNWEDAIPHQRWRFLQLAVPFFAGSAMFVFRDHVRLSLPIVLAWISLALLARAATPNFFWLIFVTGLSYTTILLGFVPKGPLLRFNRLGDYSYGLYIFGFPVQQIVMFHLVEATPLQNIIWSTPITLGLAIASWHLVEKPALGLKKRLGTSAPAHGSVVINP